ncbi:MAG: VWA domain-containing protein, partial [Myxococcales bacterium]|nr:VWA domain-containing protein [Myxococcales bacterium]
QLFPSVDAQAVLGPQACVVAGEPEVLVDFENAAAVLAGIPPAGAMDLAGGTPAEKGMNSAIDHLAGLGDMNANYIILITDGAANCSTSAADDAELLAYDVNLVPTIAAAASAGITTFVVGVDIANEVDAQGINPYEVLNDAALAGGSPKDDPSEKFYNAVNKIELEAALQQIFTSEVLSCKITLNVPDMKMFSKVEINGVEYPDPIADDVDCATTDGWRYTDESETEIELCGAACTDYQTLGTVQLIYSCFEG